MSGCTLPPPPSTVSCSPPPSVTQATLVPGSQLFIYPLRPHIYSAITPEDVIRSLSTPQLSEVASKGKESDGGGGGGRASGDVTLHVLPRDSPEDDRQALAERLFVSRWLGGKQQVLHMGMPGVIIYEGIS